LWGICARISLGRFTITNGLPRLGYLSFMDGLLLIGFFVTASVFAIDIYLKRISDKLDEPQPPRIDRYLIVGYPLVLRLGFGLG
jgi:hypothetical protein